MPDPLLLNVLQRLLPSQFAELLYRYGLPPEYLPQQVSQTEQVLALLRHAQQQPEHLVRLQTCLAQVQHHARRRVFQWRLGAGIALLITALGAGWLWLPASLSSQRLSGAVRTTGGEPLPGVTVALPAYGVSTATDAFGQFRLEVSAPAQAEVELLAQKPGYQVHEQYATLGNTSLSFTLREK